jgi:hypothetical protein
VCGVAESNNTLDWLGRFVFVLLPWENNERYETGRKIEPLDTCAREIFFH